MSPDEQFRYDDAALDFALRVGEMLLSNGAGAADVSATMSSITHYLGLRQAHVSVTFTTLTISHQNGAGEPLLTSTRQVTHRETDFDDLTRVDLLVTALLTGDVNLTEARSQLAQISSSGHRSPRWAITLSWAITGGAVAVLLGGSAWGGAIAAFTAGLLEIVLRRIERVRLPAFYGQVVGGFIASIVAVGCEAFDLPVNGSFVVITGIVMLLASLGLIGAFQDALTGFYVTSNARILEVLLSTIGIIVGVAAGLSLGQQFDVPQFESITVADLAPPPLAAAAAAVIAVGFAFSAYAPRRAFIPLALVASTATLTYVLIAEATLAPALPAAIASLMIGLTGYWVSRWVNVPPLVIVTAAIVPLLPGQSIYRGLSLMADDNVNGLISLMHAIAIAIAIAAGVMLGEYIAQPLRREAQRLERRLAGPRLVGPLRVRAVRPLRRPGSTRKNSDKK